MTFDRLAVDGHGDNTFLNVVRVLDLDVVLHTAVLSGDGEVTEAFRCARINGQTVQCRINTEDVLDRRAHV